MRIAVLITCHNRREKTLRCLASLFAQQPHCGIALEPWLVDDASSDGTRDAVERQFPAVRIVHGDGSLFWCAGMRLAWARAAETAPDVFLWLNDDVVLEPDAFASLQRTALAHPAAIVVGSCACPVSGERTYGGLRRLGDHPGRLEPVAPESHPKRCDTFEGNIVWIPAAAFARLGLLGPFQHSMGDVDYGYRAARAGIACIMAPGFLGRCSANSKRDTWEDPQLGIPTRLRKLRSIKGLPVPDWWRFCRRHGGVRAPLYFLGPFLRIVRGR